MEEHWAGSDRFAGYVQYVVGNGKRVRFWHDTWCGNQPLKALTQSYMQLR